MSTITMTIVLDSHKLSKANVQLMADAIASRSYQGGAEDNAPANSGLYFEVFDSIKNYSVRLYSRQHKVFISSGLVDFLRSQEGINCKINGVLVEDKTVSVENEEELVDELLPDD